MKQMNKSSHHVVRHYPHHTEPSQARPSLPHIQAGGLWTMRQC